MRIRWSVPPLKTLGWKAPAILLGQRASRAHRILFLVTLLYTFAAHNGHGTTQSPHKSHVLQVEAMLSIGVRRRCEDNRENNSGKI